MPLENIGGGFKKDESGKIISAGKYTPFGHTDYQQIVAEIKQFAASGDACVINTLNGDTNVPFFKEYAAAGLTAETCPVVSFSISEDEFRGLPAKDLVGQLGCWTYFQSIKTPGEQEVPRRLPGLAQDHHGRRHREGRPRDLTPRWCSATTAFTSGKPRREGRQLRCGQGPRRLEIGRLLRRPRRQGHDPEEHHLTKNVYIGETKADGQFKILKTFTDVYGEPFLKGTFKAKE